MKDLNLDEDWQTLGGPSPFRKVLNELPEKTMTFLEFLFPWISKAYSRLVSSCYSVFVLLTSPDRIMGGILCISLIVGVIAGAFSLGKVIFATGETHHCEILVTHESGSQTVYTLRGIRHWREDIIIRRDADFNKLKATAEEIGCPIK